MKRLAEMMGVCALLLVELLIVGRQVLLAAGCW
jgi:hypothetical protein